LLDERAGQFVQLLKEASERDRARREAGLARLQVRLQKMRGKDSGSA
jgi:hypothetical protein